MSAAAAVTSGDSAVADVEVVGKSVLAVAVMAAAVLVPAAVVTQVSTSTHSFWQTADHSQRLTPIWYKSTSTRQKEPVPIVLKL